MTDTSSARANDVLDNILKVLERIEARLEKHEDRFRSLEDVEKTNAAQEEEDCEDKTDSIAPIATTKDLTNDKPVLKIGYEGWSIDQFIRVIPQDIYNEWGTSHTHLDRYYSMTALSPELERRLGSCWDVPDDGRLPLKFFKSNLLKMNMSGGGPTTESFSKYKARMERELTTLCDFDDALRKFPGNDFAIVDFDPSNNSRMYRLGQHATGPELMVDPGHSKFAPWSRLILYQGATTGESIDTGKKRPEQPIPYFTRTDRINGVWNHLSCHLQSKPRTGTSNPYDSRWTGFHTVFYEILKTTDLKTRELWKHGPLYEHPFGWKFRKCAFTIYTPAPYDLETEVKSTSAHLAPHWTLLVLAPSGFFNEHSVLFPSETAEVGPGMVHVSGAPLGKLTQTGAELKFIGQSLEKISERWADFQAYFDHIIDSGNSLMHPTEHDNLLFDDGAFSRSRKYFWAIDCLSEFELSISDNIYQWELYKHARIDPLEHILPDLDRRQLDYAERQSRVIRNQRETFRQKLASIKALRDALFNASAVIESRASTRLGENVKLLTFVSIFFLPLSFTTSLWSINTQFSSTVLIYVIIIVALLTYFIMFNINSIAEGFGELYGIKKKRIVHAMKADPSSKWKQRGQRFEVFRPKHERPQPSEWYVPLYAVLHPAAIFGFGREIRDDTRDESCGERSQGWRTGISSLFRRRRSPVIKEEGRTDEGWVL